MLYFLKKENTLKRNLDLIRDIMLYLEENIDPNKPLFPVSKLEDLESDSGILNEHIKQLVENGFIETTKPIYMQGFTIFMDIQRITSNGHDFLDALRDDSVWNKTKEAVQKAGGFTLNMLVELGKEYLTKEVGLS